MKEIVPVVLDKPNEPLPTDFEVELHSTHPDAIAATAGTLKMMGAVMYEKDGRYFVRALDPGYIKWAIIQQGYVRSLVTSSGKATVLGGTGSADEGPKEI